MSTHQQPQLFTPKLIRKLRNVFALDWDGIHGAAHWSRVRVNGLILAENTGADRFVIEYFSLLHDLCRLKDGFDPEHGLRAAEFTRKELRDDIFLDTAQFALLMEAVEGHTHGIQHGNATIATCWDADRLDLGRVGVYPDPMRLCTSEAKREEVIRAAWERSQEWLE